MTIFDVLGIEASEDDIDLKMTPVDTYGLFECRGDMRRVRCRNERYYYFYIDNWNKPPVLCFMERGIRHARVLARIDAPQEMIDICVSSQGKTYKENSYAINEAIRAWLKEHIITAADAEKIIKLNEKNHVREPAASLLADQEQWCRKQVVKLRRKPEIIDKNYLKEIIRKYDFFEKKYNPEGMFRSCFTQTAADGTVLDIATGIRWMLAGSDICSYRQLQKWLKQVNKVRFAGFNDWRLPTAEEAMSLLKGEKSQQGSYIHSCFTYQQGYIYTADRRKPGGHWFVDFRQAKVFWASGTFAGGFGRPCRTEIIP